MPPKEVAGRVAARHATISRPRRRDLRQGPNLENCLCRNSYRAVVPLEPLDFLNSTPPAKRQKHLIASTMPILPRTSAETEEA